MSATQLVMEPEEGFTRVLLNGLATAKDMWALIYEGYILFRDWLMRNQPPVPNKPKAGKGKSENNQDEDFKAGDQNKAEKKELSPGPQSPQGSTRPRLFIPAVQRYFPLAMRQQMAQMRESKGKETGKDNVENASKTRRKVQEKHDYRQTQLIKKNKPGKREVTSSPKSPPQGKKPQEMYSTLPLERRLDDMGTYRNSDDPTM